MQKSVLLGDILISLCIQAILNIKSPLHIPHIAHLNQSYDNNQIVLNAF